MFLLYTFKWLSWARHPNIGYVKAPSDIKQLDAVQCCESIYNYANQKRQKQIAFSQKLNTMKNIRKLIFALSILMLLTLTFSCNDNDFDSQGLLQENGWFELPMKYETKVYNTEKNFSSKFQKILKDIETDFDQFAKDYDNKTITYLVYFEKGQLIIENITSKDNLSGQRLDFCEDYTDNKTCYSKECVATYMQEMMKKFENCAEFKIKRSTLNAKVCARACSDNS